MTTAHGTIPASWVGTVSARSKINYGWADETNQTGTLVARGAGSGTAVMFTSSRAFIDVTGNDTCFVRWGGSTFVFTNTNYSTYTGLGVCFGGTHAWNVSTNANIVLTNCYGHGSQATGYGFIIGRLSLCKFVNVRAYGNLGNGFNVNAGGFGSLFDSIQSNSNGVAGTVI